MLHCLVLVGYRVVRDLCMGRLTVRLNFFPSSMVSEVVGNGKSIGF